MTWYVVDHRVYARRGDTAHDRDPHVATCATQAIAEEIAHLHNYAVTVARTATRIGART